MNIEDVRAYGLSLPHATERCPFGPDYLALEIGGRIFCLMSLDGQWDFYNLKVKPDYSQDLCEMYSGIRPGYHMNKRHWLTIPLDGRCPADQIKSLIDLSYRLTML